MSFYDSSGQTDFTFSKPYSEKTSEKIDAEVKKIIEEQYIRAKSLLKENIESLNQLGNLLLEKEVIFSDDLELIFGKRPFAKEEAYVSKPIMDKKVEEINNADVADKEVKSESNIIDTHIEKL